MQRLEFANKSTSNKNKKTEQQVEESINKRQGHARNIALTINVFYLLGSKNVYFVQSEHSNEIYYYIKYNPDVFEWCSCPDNSIRGQTCKHIFSIEYAIRFGTLKDIDKLPIEAKRYPSRPLSQPSDTIVGKSYRNDHYSF
jgi:predicted nucleic acid-binding Zn finger protein